MVVLTSGLKLPYALAQQLIKMTFVLILQDCGGVLGLLFSDGRYAYFTMEDSLCCKLPQNKVVQFVTVPPLNALSVALFPQGTTDFSVYVNFCLSSYMRNYILEC